MDKPEFLFMGESGILLELGNTVDEKVNRKIHRLTKQLLELNIRGIREILPSYKSLLVIFDPLELDRDTLQKELTLAVQKLTSESKAIGGRVVKIPVCYGGEYGPDLPYIAAYNGLTEEEVIRIHTSQAYLVYMLGFTPGFPYLGGMSLRIATPRLETPRTEIAAKSVGIAGEQTGFYPIASPGGWQIMGRTSAEAFMPDAEQPFLLQPGDYLQFEAVEHLAAEPEKADVAEEYQCGNNYCEIVAAGLFSTVQDEGRYGYRMYGLTSAGAMDNYAYRAACILLGDDNAAVIEMTLMGGTYSFSCDCQVAVCGADMHATLNNISIGNWRRFNIKKGDVLSFGYARNGCRTYLAVRGGLMLPKVMGSYSTYTRAHLGGYKGRALREGDCIPIASKQSGEAHLPIHYCGCYKDKIQLRVLLGPHDGMFNEADREKFFASDYLVTEESDRMGCRLSGEAMGRDRQCEILSEPLMKGAIQIPPDGQPIVMMSDHQTIGGYPIIAVVIAADIDLLAQAKAGDQVRFKECSYDEAVWAWNYREKKIAAMKKYVYERYGAKKRRMRVTIAEKVYDVLVEEEES